MGKLILFEVLDRNYRHIAITLVDHLVFMKVSAFHTFSSAVLDPSTFYMERGTVLIQQPATLTVAASASEVVAPENRRSFDACASASSTVRTWSKSTRNHETI